MEPLNQRSLERVVSQRALQMGASFPCQICVVGFLCGVCIASLILATLTSFGHFSFSTMSMLNLSWNSDLDSNMSSDCTFKPKETERLADLKSRRERDQDGRVSLLYSAWSCVLTKPATGGNECLQKLGISGSNLPNAPHFENCKVKTQLYNRLDKRTGNDTYPPWTSWKGLLDTHPVAATSEQIKNFRHQAVSEGAYPPWKSNI